MATYTAQNKKEIPELTPIELPLGYKAPESLEHMIQRLVRNEQFQQQQALQGNETFEESDDFDVDDDHEIVSPYEMTQMQEDYLELHPAAAPPSAPVPTSQTGPTQPLDSPEISDPEPNGEPQTVSKKTLTTKKAKAE